MKRIKKAFRVLLFICLIVLAGIGIGITGGVPIPLSNSRRDAEKDQTELIEEEDGKSTTSEKEIKG